MINLSEGVGGRIMDRRRILLPFAWRAG